MFQVFLLFTAGLSNAESSDNKETLSPISRNENQDQEFIVFPEPKTLSFLEIMAEQSEDQNCAERSQEKIVRMPPTKAPSPRKQAW